VQDKDKGNLMHEVGIAQNLLATAQQQLNGYTAPVVALKVRLGALAGVSCDELRFGFEIAAADTPFAQAQLEIQPIPTVIYCSDCRAAKTLAADEPLHCPTCGSVDVRVVQGKELALVAIEVTDDDAG
jgi:hydrogenase nickel incorporation protein HypA/HybF